MAKDKLHVKVDGTSITVTKPGSDFAVTYNKRFDNSHLVLTNNWVPASVSSPTIEDFRTQALHAAVARRESWVGLLEQRAEAHP
jgi:hypothetical protein